MATTEPEKNKLGKTLADYKCPVCGYIHTRLFMKNKPLRRCRHGHKIEQA